MLVKALIFPFRGSGSFARLIVAFLSGLLIFPPTGYMICIAQEVTRGNLGLPEHDLVREFGMGVYATLVSILYAIPAYVIAFSYRPPIPQIRISPLYTLDYYLTWAFIEAVLLILLAYVPIILVWIFFNLLSWVGILRWITENNMLLVFDFPRNALLAKKHAGKIIWATFQYWIGVFLIQIGTIVLILFLFTIHPFLVFTAIVILPFTGGMIIAFTGALIGYLAKSMGLLYSTMPAGADEFAF